MKRIALLSVAAIAALSLSSCVKLKWEATIANDASSTMHMSWGLKTDAVETMRDMIESTAGEVEGMDEGMEKMNEMFDKEKVSAQMKASGLEITKATSEDKEGWKTMAIEAKVKNINSWIDKSAKEMKKEIAQSGATMPPGMGDITKLIPNFYKTKVPGVGQMRIVPNISELLEDELGEAMDMLDELDDETREQYEGQIDMMKAAFSVDEMKVEMVLNLPGAIVDMKGCKKVSEKSVKFTLGGSDLSLDGAKNVFGMKNGVSVSFKIPEDCKIKFLDMPTKGSKTAPSKTEATEEAPKKKKGGLKIGEEGGNGGK